MDTMQWEKLGLIYGPEGKNGWDCHSALQPTPIIIDDRIRVYIGIRDQSGVGRIGYVDLDLNDPTKIIDVAKNPVLDIGAPGAFDDNGVIPGAVLRHDGKIYLYYAGYQLVEKVRFKVFSGLAVSEDNGDTFKRYSQVPIMERTDEGVLFRAIHSVIVEDGKWKVYYGAGSRFVEGAKKSLPVYNIRYLESTSGVDFPKKGKVIIDINENEHRVGRPYVYKDSGKYKLLYGIGTEEVPYRLSYAESDDGVSWVVDEEKMGIEFSQSGWDSEMMAYPSVVQHNGKTFLFYNGNNYGKEGFGLAVLKN